MRSTLVQRLQAERGIALILALGLLIVFGIVVTGAISYSTSNTRASASNQTRVSARQVAEAGMNAALAVLNEGSPTNANQLGSKDAPLTQTVDGGTATYWGTYTSANGDTYWSITSVGSVPNPSSGGQPSQIAVTAKVPIQPSAIVQATPASNPWTFFWSKDANPSSCDQTFTTKVTIPLVEYGDVCVDWISGATPTGLLGTSLHMKTANSTIWVKNLNARVGNSSNPMTGYAVQTAGGTKCMTSYNGATGLAPHTCTTGTAVADATHLTRDNVHSIGSSPTSIAAPIADFDYWYSNGSPGPFSKCNVTSTGGSYLPTLEDETSNPTRNNSLNTAAVFDLTPPGHSYDCIIGTTNGNSNGWCSTGSNSGNLGQITWDATNKQLTIIGTTYIDGSVKISNATLTTLTYTCYGSLYTSGTILLKNTKLCGALFDSTCTGGSSFGSRWWPFLNWLFLVADGDASAGGAAAQGGDMAAGDGIKLINSSFQGGLYATKAIHFDATSKFNGPAVGGTLIFDGDFTSSWDTSSSRMPSGTPGIQQNTKTQIQQPVFGG
jgi:Tfp pilus assembly protein PilX